MTAATRGTSDTNSQREEFMAFLMEGDSVETVRSAAGKAGFSADRVFQNDITKAIETLETIKTPKLLLIDLDQTSDPDAIMDSLAEVCDPGTEVIAVGSRNDVSLYRHLVAMGVRDYLIKPLDAEQLHEALSPDSAPAQAGRKSSEDARVDIVLGSKGGAGATTIAVNTAWHYADQLAWKTILLDLDPYFGTTAMQFDLEPGRGFREALEDPDRIDDLFLERAMIQVAKNLYLLGSEENLNNPIEAAEDSVTRIIEFTKGSFDRIVVDLPQAQLPYAHSLLKIADSITIVTDMTLSGLRDVIRINAALKEMGILCRQIFVANQVGLSKTGEMDAASFEKSLEKTLSAQVPHNPDIFFRCTEDGKAALSQNKGGKVLTELQKAAKAMSGVKEEKAAGILGRIFSKKGGK